MKSFAKNLLHRKQKHHSHHHHHHHQSDNAPPERHVFAHYMVGLTDGQTAEEWLDEIQTARAAGIDGFALNIGPSDPWTWTQLGLAYAAAGEAVAASSDSSSSSSSSGGGGGGGGRGGSSPFVLFLSFDMAAGGDEWTVAQVCSLIRAFRDDPAQCRVRGRPLVSTFEGPGWAERWAAVRRGDDDDDAAGAGAGGDIFLVPDWSSLGPEGVRRRLGVVDGAFSWAAWPRAGRRRVTVEEDVAYGEVLGGKEYMMGVSPWFYTRLPQWSKNWHSSGESLWYDRWKQIWELKPRFVQIITWNDFGESSYIRDPQRPSQVVPGAEKYVVGHSHDAFRATLPYLIQVYKAAGGGARVVPERDCAVAWYRTTPAACGPDGGTVWGQGGVQSAREGTSDIISVLTITAEPATLVLRIGDSSPPQELRTHQQQHKHEEHRHVSFFEVPVDGRTGEVTISLHGRTTSGPPIRDECPPFGHVVYNCTAISV